MGLPGVSIPSDVFLRIQAALEACSAGVDVLAVSDQDVRLGLLAAFRCRSQEGDVVLVRVHTAKHISPDGIAAVLQPETKRLFVSQRHQRYMNEIQASLVAHGAVRLGKPRKGREAEQSRRQGSG